MSRDTVVIWKVLILALVVSQASAQVNIEKLRKDDERKGLSGSFDLDLSARTGNVDVLEFAIGGRVDHMSQSTTTFLVGSSNLGWEGGERYSNEALVHLRQVYRYRPWLRPEGFVQIDYDKSRALTFRGLIGGGLRLGLYRNTPVQVWWGSTYIFEHERLDLGSAVVHPRRTSAHRWSSYLSSKVGFNEQTILAWTTYVQPRFDNLEDVRVFSDARLGVELSHRVSLVVTLRVRYDSRPPDGTESIDTILKTGVGIKFPE